MPPTPSKPSIEYRHNVARTRHEIGVKIGKVFVPFATLDDARYAQLAENADNTTEATSDDEGADD